MAGDMNGFPKTGNLSLLDIKRDDTNLNRAIPQVVVKSTSDETNVDLVLSPKGSGAVQVQQADGTIIGGNKRATNTVDLQFSRTAATQVAAGSSSFVCGINNTSSNTNAFAMGDGCMSSGSTATAIGYQCIASGSVSFVTGINGDSFSTTGRRVHASGMNGVSGDSQVSDNGYRAATTNATPLLMSIINLNYTANSKLTLQTYQSIYFKGSILAKQSGSTNVAVWTFSGVIQRGSTAASTAFVGTPTITAVTNIPAWTIPAFSVDTTLGSLDITVTGVAATNIRWFADIKSAEIIYN